MQRCCALVLVLPLLLAACGRPATPRPANTASPPANSTAPAASPTATPLPSPTPTQTPAATARPALPGKVAFYRGDGVSSSAIWQIDADGSNEHVLLVTDTFVYIFRMEWSPDGTQLVYSSTQNNDIIVVDADGRNARNLTNSKDFAEVEPSWSPDGSRIAFASNRLAGSDRNHYDIFVMNADGSDVEKLTECPVKCLYPAWSPDGSYLAYSNGNDLYVMHSNGADPVNLTHGVGINGQPAWMPDGRRLAFIRTLQSAMYFEHSGYIYLIDRDGSHLTALTGEGDSAMDLSIAPDGNTLAFRDTGGNHPDGIYFLNVNSGEIWPLVAPGSEAAWYVPKAASLPGTPNPDCSAGWSRLQPGDQARLLGNPGDPPNRVRTGPGTKNEIVALIQPGTLLQILQGPVCADGLVFWQVNGPALAAGPGWTAEGDGTTYWLEPVSP